VTSASSNEADIPACSSASTPNVRSLGPGDQSWNFKAMRNSKFTK